jgi:hypothetical protein
MRFRAGYLVAAQLCVLLSVRGADFYVSPQGKSGNGSQARPWDLQTALRHPASVRPGDTIWLRGGVYSPRLPYAPGFRSYLTGDPKAPIIVRQYPGERATLIETIGYTGTDQQVVLSIWGYHTWFWGFEITNTNATRKIDVAGSNPTPAELPMASAVDVVGGDIKLINLIIHDTRGGLALWTSATNAEAYGCIVYNNGWVGSDGGQGPGIYCQNRRGVRRLRDNIVFNQFSPGIFGFTVNSFLRNISLERNIVFNNAHMAADTTKDTGAQVLFGGGTRIENLRILDNCFYQALDLHGPVIRTDYGANSNSDVVFAGNYIAGGSGGGNNLVSATRFDSLGFSNNTLYSTNGFLINLEPRPGFAVDRNAYYGNANRNFGMTTTNGTSQSDFAEWQTTTGFDAQGNYFQDERPPNKIVVNANAYEPKRTTVAVYNWSDSDEVSVDVGNVLSKGDAFVVHNAQDFFAPPVLTGTYAGDPLILPMTNLTVAIPNGWTNTNAIPRTGKQFNVFVLIGSSSSRPQPTK